MDDKAPVFAGQIFAEMLAGLCHEEFYRYSDQEVNALPCCLSLYFLHHLPPICHPCPILLFSLLHVPQTLTFIGIRDTHHTHLLPTISCLPPPNIPPISPRHRLRPSSSCRTIGQGKSTTLAPIQV